MSASGSWGFLRMVFERDYDTHCPTCDVDEDAPNLACASWVHPGSGPSQDHLNRSEGAES